MELDLICNRMGRQRKLIKNINPRGISIMKLISNLSLCFLCFSAALSADDSKFSFNPPASVYKEQKVLDSFDSDESTWTEKHGHNAEIELKNKWNSPENGLEKPLLLIRSKIKDNSTSYGSWFYLSRNINDSSDWKNADGLCVSLALEEPGTWWLEFRLTCDGEDFFHVLEPYNYESGRKFVTRILPFSNFKSKSGKTIDLDKINRISIGGSARNNIMYLDKITLYKINRNENGITFSTNKKRLPVFEKGESITLFFNAKQIPENSKSLQIEIQDYFGNSVKKDSITNPIKEKDSFTYKYELGSLITGYYEVRAWYLDASGKRIYPDSCISPSGSLLDSRGTFAIMPSTIAENRKELEKYGDKAFFGFHGSYDDLLMLMGAKWTVGFGKWEWMEKDKPDRKNGESAAWLQKKLDAIKNSDAKFLNIMNIGLNVHGIPAWAVDKQNPDKAPGIADWKFFEDYFRDAIRYEKAKFSYMPQRIYDPAWEINLNSPEAAVQKPIYQTEDLIELYRRADAIVKSEDPAGITAGPCTSTITDMNYPETVMNAGLLKYIGAWNTHGYHTPPPEKDRVPEKLRQLRQMIRNHNNGKELDIYCTELGLRSQYGAADRHREQAQWHVRAAVIFKGEGVKAYMAFYPYDLEGTAESWGFCYYTQPKFQWSPPSLAPKSAVPAYAVCIQQLEGAEPLYNTKFYGNDVYGYMFKKDGELILVIWSVEENHKITLADTNSKGLQVVDIMGRENRVNAQSGLFDLEISPSPIYVKGLSNSLYSEKPEQTKIVESFPGSLISSEKTESITSAPAGMQIQKNGIRIPKEIKSGIYPLFSGNNKSLKAQKWVLIKDPLEIKSVEPVMKNGQTGAEVTVSNMSPEKIDAELSLSNIENGEQKKSIAIQAQSEEKVFIPFKSAETGRSYVNTVKLSPLSMTPLSCKAKINFLAAWKKGENSKDRLENTMSWSGKGSSGKKDSAKASFEWDEKMLYLNITVNDDDFAQSINDASMWKEDSLQIAFDTDPGSDDPYNPLGGVFNKKITELSFALTEKNEKIAWRHMTHNKNELKTGDISQAISMDFSRDNKTSLTVYKIGIPWKEIGLDSVKSGKIIGISILVNDKDKDGKRAGLELFGGIMHGKNHKMFGTVILQ